MALGGPLPLGPSGVVPRQWRAGPDRAYVCPAARGTSWASLEVVEAVGGAALPARLQAASSARLGSALPPPFPHSAPSSPRPAPPWGGRALPALSLCPVPWRG